MCTLITPWLTHQSIFIFKDHCENVAVPVEKPSHFANEEILAERDDDDSLTETVETDDKDDLVSHDEGTCIYV